MANREQVIQGLKELTNGCMDAEYICATRTSGTSLIKAAIALLESDHSSEDNAHPEETTPEAPAQTPSCGLDYCNIE